MEIFSFLLLGKIREESIHFLTSLAIFSNRNDHAFIRNFLSNQYISVFSTAFTSLIYLEKEKKKKKIEKKITFDLSHFYHEVHNLIQLCPSN